MDITYILGVTKALLSGVKVVTILFFVALAISIPLGFLFTLMARSKVKPIRWLANAYIYIIRGTPLMLQLFFIYFGLPYMPLIGQYLQFSSFVAAIIGFTLNYAAYFAEIFRGGLLAIDPGQYEAAKVLGFTKRQTMFRIILPQMIRVVMPSITNESITLIKDTALIYAVAVPEILHYAKVAVSRDSNPMAFVIAFVIYLVMNTILQLFFKWLEKKIDF